MTKPKQTKNKLKTQVNIEKYLHNVSSKNQNILRMEEDKNTIKSSANESNFATQKVIDRMIVTNKQNNNGNTHNLLLVKMLKLKFNNYCYLTV